MNVEQNITILIAEDNDISRELMSSVLKTQGFHVIAVSDGTEALNTIDQNAVDLALLDLNMEPMGGFEFMKQLLLKGIKLPVAIITADESTDILSRASSLGVTRVLQKPVEPERLISMTQNILKRHGHNFDVIATQTFDTHYSHEQLMQRTIDLAERNAKSKHGGPFGAIIANEKGEILGEGANGITSRVDPTAHAEIMAIRQASERLGRADLSDCILYCSSEPTMMGQALIRSVGIPKVYFGLSHDDIHHLCTREKQTPETHYEQISSDSAMKMFKRWQGMEDRLEN